MKQASLEEAFMELTEDSVDFRASMLDTPTVFVSSHLMSEMALITTNGATS